MKWGPLGFPPDTPINTRRGEGPPPVGAATVWVCPSFCNHSPIPPGCSHPLAWSLPGRELRHQETTAHAWLQDTPIGAEARGCICIASITLWSSGLLPRRTYCSNLLGDQKWVKRQSSEWVLRWAYTPIPAKMTSATHRSKGASRAFSC